MPGRPSLPGRSSPNCPRRAGSFCQGRPGQARPGQGRAGQGRPGQGRAGQGRPGRARPGQGRPGQARQGQARAGQWPQQWPQAPGRGRQLAVHQLPHPWRRVLHQGDERGQCLKHTISLASPLSVICRPLVPIKHTWSEIQIVQFY